MAENSLGHEDAAWLRQRLEPRRDVDAVAIEVAALDHHVAEVDSDAKDDPPILGQPWLAASMASCSATAHSTASTALANSTSTPSPITLTMRPRCLAISGLEDVPSTGLEGGQRTGLVRLHEAAVADHIGGQNGGKTALGAFFGHLVPLVLHAAVQQIVGAPRREVYRPGLRIRVNRVDFACLP